MQKDEWVYADLKVSIPYLKIQIRLTSVLTAARLSLTKALQVTVRIPF